MIIFIFLYIFYNKFVYSYFCLTKETKDNPKVRCPKGFLWNKILKKKKKNVKKKYLYF